jgi:hypothetical protein
MIACPVCSDPQEVVFSRRILNKYDVDYLFCNSCKFLCTEKPYWLADSYADAIARSDTDVMRRNLNFSAKVFALFRWMFGASGKYLDVSGGSGVLTRLMRDFGFDYYCQDDHAKNLFARGFEGAIESGEQYRGVTAVEVIDHIDDPLGLIRRVLDTSGCEAFVFSTHLYHGDHPPEVWWNYAENSGQHVALFHRTTLERIAAILHLHLNSHGSIHMLSKQRIGSSMYSLLTGRVATKLTPLLASLMLKSRIQSDSELLIKDSRR